MKYGFACLLLSLASVVTGNTGQDETCTFPPRVFQVWAQSCCTGRAMRNFVDDFMKGKDTLTSVNMITFAEQYCSEIKPKVKECFRRKIEHCEKAHQITMLFHANETSVICNSGSNSVRQEILDFLRRNVFGSIMLSESCESAVTLLNSVPAFNANDERYSRDSFSDFKILAQEFFVDESKQVIGIAKQQKSSCTQWKWQALKRILQDSGLIRPEPFSVKIENIQEILDLFRVSTCALRALMLEMAVDSWQ